MLVLLSPSKTMDMNPLKEQQLPPTSPVFSPEAEMIAREMKQFSEKELSSLLDIKKELLKLNYDRFQSFDNQETRQKEALLAYHGSLYGSLKAETLTKEELAFAQEHIRIVSTLYGILKPLDLIKAYRMSFKIQLKNLSVKNLYQFWMPLITPKLIDACKSTGGLLINLSSIEIFNSIDKPMLMKDIKVITPIFKELKDGEYKNIRIYSKQMRGTMARYIITHKITQAEDLKKFNLYNYNYNSSLSSSDTFVFTKQTNK